MADIIQIRRDTAANWGTVDPVLAQGEFAWALDTNTLKLGDGSTIYSLLPTFSGSIEAQDDGVSIVSAMAFNFTGSGVVVTNVGGVATIAIAAPPGAPVDSVFGRTGIVVAQNGDYTAGQITYDNAGSGLSAITVQAAVDEIETRVDNLESAGAPVDSVFGRTGVVVAQASDYDADQVDFDDTNVPITAPDAQSAIQQLYDRVGVFEAFNTDTTTDLNTAGLTQVPIFGTITQAGPAGYFTVAGNLLTVNIAMKIKVSSNVNYQAIANRVNAAIGTSFNGVITGATGRSGYIRNNSGHNESSVHMSTILDCAIGDQIGLFSQQQAAAGATTMIAARSNYIVEIMELL